MPKTCFLCNRDFFKSEKKFGPLDLGKEGIEIPARMTEKDQICEECYLKEKSRYKHSKKPSFSVGPDVRGVEIHDKVLSPEEIKKMYERGPPSFDDKTVHTINHKDEDEGYMWVDGKKVKKHNPKDSK